MATLADILKPDFITVAPEDTLGRLIGVLTERDMLRAMAARMHTSVARVRQWMTSDPITASSDMALDDAAKVMLDNGFRHLPVMEGDTVLGVVSLRRVLGGRRQPAPEAA